MPPPIHPSDYGNLYPEPAQGSSMASMHTYLERASTRMGERGREAAQAPKDSKYLGFRDGNFLAREWKLRCLGARSKRFVHDHFGSREEGGVALRFGFSWERMWKGLIKGVR